MPTMEPPTPSTPTTDSHPSIPVSHPRSSPRSHPSSSPAQPPISPPRSSGVNNTATQLTSSVSPVACLTEAAVPPMPLALSHSPPGVQVDPEPHRIPTVSKADLSEQRIPNVYVNGLPPNFPEEQLYALTKDFGPIVSVRTFTRHVSDRPSGYGFVLFEAIESAEKCIEALRRYRNLHPSFCKNFHPIPGTRYASLTTSGTQPSESPSSGTDGDTFKSRMERLKDEASTNLYIEGLPLQIDEPTLAALVAPYTIKSSRLFQTRLSHPPRTIAFVRLDTRSACDEIIKRLHGRMVRGWNDPGSRISVRYADSAEQRELRRCERSGREDDSSPARLTMAQAALLNLRGQQMQDRLRVSQHPTNLPDQRRVRSVPPPVGVHDYPIPGAHQNQHGRLPPHPFISQGQQEPENGPLTTSLSAPARLQGRNELVSDGLPTPLGSEIDLSTLSRTAGANGFTPLEQQLILQARVQVEIDARQRAFYGSQSSNSLPKGPMQTPSLLSGQSEELSRSMNNLSLRSAHVVKEFVPRGPGSRLHQYHTYSSPLSSRLSADLLPSEVVDGYRTNQSHNSPQSLPLPSCQQQHQPGSSSATNPRVLNLASKDSLKKNHSSSLIGDQDSTVRMSNSLDLVTDDSDRRVSTQREDQQNLAAHMRSTTLPPHFTVSDSNTAHNTNMGVVNLRLNGILSPNLPSGARVGDRGQTGRLNVGIPSGELSINHQIDTLTSDAKLIQPHNSIADSPFFIPSPALTYNSSSSASSRTPSTLSPSTPFFGSFPHPGDSYGAYNGEEHGGEKTDAAMAHDVTAFDIGTKIRSGSG